MGESTLDESDPACANVVNDVAERTQKWLSVNGTRSVDWFHRELGKLVWNFIGMERDKNGLEKALSEIPSLREEFEKDVRVLGTADNLNTSLEKVGRVADFFELAELKARDALERNESCGAISELRVKRLKEKLYVMMMITPTSLHGNGEELPIQL